MANASYRRLTVPLHPASRLLLSARWTIGSVTKRLCRNASATHCPPYATTSQAFSLISPVRNYMYTFVFHSFVVAQHWCIGFNYTDRSSHRQPSLAVTFNTLHSAKAEPSF